MHFTFQIDFVCCPFIVLLVYCIAFLEVNDTLVVPLNAFVRCKTVLLTG